MPKKKEIIYIIKENGCWECTSHKSKQGQIHIRIDGIKTTVHTFFYKKYIGDIPKGMTVRRRCSNINCINPTHLYLANKVEHLVSSQKEITYSINKKTNCWECTSHKVDENGYPNIVINKKRKRIGRYMYEKYIGLVPKGLILRHTCDNPVCINPDHLIVGTQYDNMKDMVNRNRQAKGSKNGQSKLNEQGVKEIKKLLQKGITQREIANKFNVTHQCIFLIASNKTWKHIE